MFVYKILIRLIALSIGVLIVAAAIKMAIFYRTPVDDYESYTIKKHQTARSIETQLNCLAKNIYWEAGSESFEGKVAVAQVTINRTKSDSFPSTVCEVVYQRTYTSQKLVCQFSWFCLNTDSRKTIHKETYRESEEVAKMVLLEGFRLPNLKEALYYHADYVNPKWNKPRIGKIGKHIFYKESASNKPTNTY